MNPMMADQSNIQNQMGLANALRMQSLQPIQNVSAYPGSELSWTQVLANMLAGHASNNLQQRATDDSRMLAQRMQGDVEQGINELQSGMSSDNPRDAIVRAMAHYDPRVREAAKQAEKGLFAPKDLVKVATPESILASKGNLRDLIAKRNLGTLNSGEVVIDNNTGRLVNPESDNGAGANLVNVGGDVYQQTATGMKKLDNAPRISNTVNMPNPESAFAKRFGEEQASMLSDDIKARNSSVNALDSISEAQDLLKKGIHAGALADLTKGLDKASIAAFKTDPGKAARTEQFQSAIGDIVLGRTKELTGVISNSDREYLEAVSAGKITLEPTAMKGILDRIEKGMRKKVLNTDKSIQGFKNRGYTLPTIDDGVLRELPDTSNKTNDLDSFLRSKGF